MITFTHQDKKVLPTIRELTTSKLYPLSNAVKSKSDIVEWVDNDFDTEDPSLDKTSFSPKEIYAELPISDRFIKQDGVRYEEALKPWLSSMYRTLNTEMMSEEDGTHMQGIFNDEHANNKVTIEGDYMTLREAWNLGTELSKLYPMPRMYASMNQWKAWASEPVTSDNKTLKYEFSLGSLGGCPLVRTTSQVGAVVAYPDENYQVNEKGIHISHFEKADSVQHFLRAVSYVEGKFINPNNVWITEKAPEFIIEDGTDVDDTMFEAYQGFAGIVNWVKSNSTLDESETYYPICYLTDHLFNQEIEEALRNSEEDWPYGEWVYLNSLMEPTVGDLSVDYMKDDDIFVFYVSSPDGDYSGDSYIETLPPDEFEFMVYLGEGIEEPHYWNDETGTIGEPIPLE